MTDHRAPRIIELELAGDRPLTVNKVAGTLHRQQWARHTKATRAAWWALALEQKVPALNACTITVTPLHADRRSPQDVAACAPEAKAAIDGLIDAGMLHDDSPGYLHAVTFRPPDVVGYNGMRLVVLEVLT